MKQYYSTSNTNEHESISLDNLPEYVNKSKIDIQSGTGYKLPVAAINACGRGEWSEISAYKTYLPGYPSALFAIKIIKVSEVVTLKWEISSTSNSKILEYSVCLAIKNTKEVLPLGSKSVATNSNFFRVYCGSHNFTIISHESLGIALINRTNKPKKNKKNETK